MRTDPLAVAASRAEARGARHLRHIRQALDELHAAVAGDPALERAADRLHAHLGAGLAALLDQPMMVFGPHPNTGGVDPGPKPSQRQASAAQFGPA